MSEIIETVPWHCGDRDCPDGWHLANYWMHEDGTYSCDYYSDGDHDAIDENELPDCREVNGSWLEYWTDALESGKDVLGEIHGRTVEEKRVWQIRISNSIVGPYLHSVRPAHRDRSSVTGFSGRGEWLHVENIPEHVAAYCLYDKTPPLSRYWSLTVKKGYDEYCAMVRECADVVVQEHAANYIAGGFTFFAPVERTLRLPPTATKVRGVARQAIKEYRGALGATEFSK